MPSVCLAAQRWKLSLTPFPRIDSTGKLLVSDLSIPFVVRCLALGAHDGLGGCCSLFNRYSNPAPSDGKPVFDGIYLHVVIASETRMFEFLCAAAIRLNFTAKIL